MADDQVPDYVKMPNSDTASSPKDDSIIPPKDDSLPPWLRETSSAPPSTSSPVAPTPSLPVDSSPVAPSPPPVAPAPAPVPMASVLAPCAVPPVGTAAGSGLILGMGTDADMTDPNKAAGQVGERFWIPKGESRYVIFLSDGAGPAPYGPPVLFEHNVPLGQGKMRWLNWRLCIEPLGIRCPLCEFAELNDGIGRRYKGMFFTVFDLTEWTDKQGKKHGATRKFLVAKKDTKEKIERKYLSRIEAGDKLRGAMYKIFRGSSDKSAAVGDDFEFVKMVDLNKIENPEDREPFNLIEKFNLKDIETVKKQVFQAAERLKIEAAAISGRPTADSSPPPSIKY